MMKRVSFEIAKALKEAGYPQKYSEYYFDYPDYQCIAPYYIEAWLWLWREKKIYINTDISDGCTISTRTSETGIIVKLDKNLYAQDPEEAIESAINYLVERNLIK